MAVSHLPCVALLTLLLGAAALRPSDMETDEGRLSPEMQHKPKAHAGGSSLVHTSTVDPKALHAMVWKMFFDQTLDETGTIPIAFFNSHAAFCIQHLRNAIDKLVVKDGFEPVVHTEDGGDLTEGEAEIIKAIRAIVLAYDGAHTALRGVVGELADLAGTTASDVDAPLLAKLKKAFDDVGERFVFAKAGVTGSFIAPLYKIYENLGGQNFDGLFERFEIRYEGQTAPDATFTMDLQYVVAIMKTGGDGLSLVPTASPLITMARDSFTAVFELVETWRNTEEAYFGSTYEVQGSTPETTDEVPINVGEEPVANWDSASMAKAMTSYKWPKITK